MRQFCRSCHLTLHHVHEFQSLLYSCTKQESCHVMLHVVAHATNTNDIMHASCDMCMPASQLSLDIYDVPEITY